MSKTNLLVVLTISVETSDAFSFDAPPHPSPPKVGHGGGHYRLVSCVGFLFFCGKGSLGGLFLSMVFSSPQ